MKKEKLRIDSIPAIIWGEASDKVYLFVHGKMSSKEYAEHFAEIAEQKGYQTISFDLPEHGERHDEKDRCDIWNGIRDLNVIGNYVFEKWETVSLFACSLGAFFSLHAYGSRKFKKCLFQSPIVDMNYLIGQMFIWFNVSEELLKEKKEIPTPVDILSWDYYCYVKEHPIEKWPFETHILYGAKDNLQSRDTMERFCEKFHCRLTVSENSEHPFMALEDGKILTQWFKDCI